MSKKPDSQKPQEDHLTDKPIPKDEDSVVEEAIEIVDNSNIPDEKKATLRYLLFQHHSGPLPHPSKFKGYDEVLPGSAERILASFERQSKHRQEMERKIVYTSSAVELRAQFFAFIIVLVGFGTGIYLTMNNHDTVGGVVFSTTIAAVVAAFLIGRRSSEKETDKTSGG